MIEQDIQKLSQQIEDLRREMRDNVMTFCGHPAMRITFERGDVLVIKVKDFILSEELADKLKARAEKLVPEGVRVMVIGPNFDIIKLSAR